jgi:hypothetical protein
MGVRWGCGEFCPEGSEDDEGHEEEWNPLTGPSNAWESSQAVAPGEGREEGHEDKPFRQLRGASVAGGAQNQDSGAVGAARGGGGVGAKS